MTKFSTEIQKVYSTPIPVRKRATPIAALKLCWLLLIVPSSAQPMGIRADTGEVATRVTSTFL